MNTQKLNPNLNLVQKMPPNHLDASIATAQVMAALGDGRRELPEDAFQILSDRNLSLLTNPNVEIKDCLTRQIVLLENLFLHFARKGVEPGRPEHTGIYIKAALGCQRALVVALGAIHRISEDEANVQALDS